MGILMLLKCICYQLVVIASAVLSMAYSAPAVTDLAASTLPAPVSLKLVHERALPRVHGAHLDGRLTTGKRSGPASERDLSTVRSEPVMTELTHSANLKEPRSRDLSRRSSHVVRVPIGSASTKRVDQENTSSGLHHAVSSVITDAAGSLMLGESSLDLPGIGGDSNYECPDKKCKNGGTLQNCQCICVNGWGGIRCGVCRIGVQPPRSSRRLLAISPGDSDDESEDEEEKAKRELLRHPPSIGDCKQGSFVKATCSCRCKPDWSGLMCDGCKHPPCQNGGKLDTKSCSCNCVGFWEGKTCTQCKIEGAVPYLDTFRRDTDRSQMKCYHGDFIRPECRCKCDADWAGDFCNKCEHGACGLHGELDSQVCRCNCALAWVGKFCTTCTHNFCKYPDHFPASACKWIKEELHCPGDGQLQAVPEKVPLPTAPFRTGGVKKKPTTRIALTQPSRSDKEL